MRLPPFALERHFAAHEFRVRQSLSSSDCEPLTLSELLGLADDETRGLWEKLSLGYTESRGLPLLRREIAKLVPDTDEDDVVTAVPEEGIFLAMQAAVTPGSRVIVTAPAYQSLHEIPRYLGALVSLWMPDETPNGWHFDPDRLRKLAEKKASVIVINFPHNPTGALPSQEEFREIVAIAQSSGAVLFSDEMYRSLELEGPSLPSAIELYPRAIALGGTSKTLSTPGLRAGYLICKEKQLLDRIAELKDYTTICGSAPSEILALIALRARDELVRRNRERIRENLVLLNAFAKQHQDRFTWRAPVAGSVGLARLLGAESASQFCDRLLRERELLLIASPHFDFGDAHVRFGLGRRNFKEALAELAAYVSG